MGVILPFAFADSVVTNLVVKVSQGNTARTGQAWLYHDGMTDAGEVISDVCTINELDDPSNEFEGPLDSTTVCTADPLVGASLKTFDSLSVFVKADSGSFEGATACVLLATDQTVQ